MLSLFITIAVVHLLAVMAPGPDFLFVSRTGLSQSRAAALAGATGITIGIACWAGLSFLGLHIVFEHFPWLQKIIMAAGGLYLSWSGYQLIKSALAKPAEIHEQHSSSVSHEKAKPTPAAQMTVIKALCKGIATNLANPKAVVYFGTIFSTFVTPDISSAVCWLLFTFIVLESLAWFMFVALLFGLDWLRHGYRKVSRWIDGSAGLAFAGFGVSLIISAAF